MSLAKLKSKVKDKAKTEKPTLKTVTGKKVTKDEFKKEIQKRQDKAESKPVKMQVDWKELRKEYGQVLTASELAKYLGTEILKEELTGKNLRRYLRSRYGGTIDETECSFAVQGRYYFDTKVDEHKDELKAIFKHYKSLAKKRA